MVYLALLMSVLFAACGDDNNDTLFSGFSLVVIIVIAILLIRHFAKKD